MYTIINFMGVSVFVLRQTLFIDERFLILSTLNTIRKTLPPPPKRNTSWGFFLNIEIF